MQLGPDFNETFALTADLVAQVLGGTKPGDIPIRQISRVVLTVNLAAARELGVTVPKSILLRADQGIE